MFELWRISFVPTLLEERLLDFQLVFGEGRISGGHVASCYLNNASFWECPLGLVWSWGMESRDSLGGSWWRQELVVVHH